MNTITEKHLASLFFKDDRKFLQRQPEFYKVIYNLLVLLKFKRNLNFDTNLPDKLVNEWINFIKNYYCRYTNHRKHVPVYNFVVKFILKNNMPLNKSYHVYRDYFHQLEKDFSRKFVNEYKNIIDNKSVFLF